MRWPTPLLVVLVACLAGWPALGDEPADDPAEQHRGDHMLSGGPWRRSLSKHGWTIDPTYVGEVFDNLQGGLRRGAEYRGAAGLHLAVDTGKAGWWPGGGWDLQLQNLHGRSATAHRVGDLQVIDNLDWKNYTRALWFWYRHSFTRDPDRSYLRLGNQDATDVLNTASYTDQFIHSSPGLIPTFPVTTYAGEGWSLLGRNPLAGPVELRWGLMRAQGSTPSGAHELMVAVEPGLEYALAGQPGHVRAGLWYSDARFDRLPAPGSGSSRGNEGWYLVCDQQVCQQGKQPADKGRGLGVFGQYGWAPASRNLAHEYYGLGAQWRGALPGRDRDVLGAGVFHLAVSARAGLPRGTETAWELFYQVEALPWLTLQPDLMWIQHPGATTRRNALVLGLRTNLKL